MTKNEEKPGLPELDLVATKREFIETFFRRGAEFTEELMRDNERLRYRVVQLEAELKAAGGALADRPGTHENALSGLVARIASLEAERDQLLKRYEGVARESEDFHTRYADIERENNNLANLYVASYQLHSTMDLREVTRIILEILLNFVGAKTFAVLLVDEEKHAFRVLAAEGLDKGRVPLPSTSEGRVAEVLRGGAPFFDEARFAARADLERPAIIAPLRIGAQVVGVIVVWDLLVQKTTLLEVDYELFNLLGAHAASALQGAKLTAELAGRPPALWAAADLV